MSISTQVNDVRRTVQEHYGELARQAKGCCDSSGCGCDSFYPGEMIDVMPADITNFSLGCGNPITQANLQPGETVVDLGSGGGLDCFFAARQVGPTGRVIGVDMTPDMLARARANAERVGAHNVEFREGYIEHLPVADGEADVIISNCVINLSPDKLQVFREMYRALRPGGRVAVSDVVVKGGQLPEAIRENVEAWSACVAGALPEEEYASGLKAAGFVDVYVEPKEEYNDGDVPLLAAGVPYSALITARKPG